MAFQEKYKNQIDWLLQGDPALHKQTIVTTKQQM